MADAGLSAGARHPARAADGAAAQPRRRAADGFRRLAAVTAGLALALVAVGGAVRATDSGLACPDWPRCFGQWVPPAGVQTWLEHSHRLLAGVVGLLVLTLAVWAVAALRRHAALVWAAVAALVLVTAQAGLGALVVLNLLRAELVTAHLGLAMIVVACLLGLAHARAEPPGRRLDDSSAGAAAPARAVAWAALAVGLLCLVQILVGGQVTGVAAGLVYTDFPLMDGTLVPAVSDAREALHVTHRLLAFVLAAGVVWLWAFTRRRLPAAHPARRPLVRLGAGAVALVALQIALGALNLWSRTAAPVVIAHLAVASWLWAVLVVMWLRARSAAGRPALATAWSGEEPQ